MNLRLRSEMTRAAMAAALFTLAGCAHQPATRPATTARTGTGSPPASAATTRSDHRYTQDQDSGPGGPLPDVSKIAEPIPKAEAQSVYGNKSPYTVLGQSYKVLPSASGYVERGIASWYGNKFHGFTTSNFEKYDMYAYTAAHKTLPLPSYARVTNLDNGASVIVRINDRGPFAEESHYRPVLCRCDQARYLAKRHAGLVEVRAIDLAHPDLAPTRRAAQPAPAPGKPAQIALGGATPVVSTPTADPPVAKSGHKPQLYLQVGAYSDHANAERAATTLRNARLGEVRIVDSVVNGRSIQRVRLGPLRDVAEADSLSPRVRALGLGEPHAAIDD